MMLLYCDPVWKVSCFERHCRDLQRQRRDILCCQIQRLQNEVLDQLILFVSDEVSSPVTAVLVARSAYMMSRRRNIEVEHTSISIMSFNSLIFSGQMPKNASNIKDDERRNSYSHSACGG